MKSKQENQVYIYLDSHRLGLVTRYRLMSVEAEECKVFSVPRVCCDKSSKLASDWLVLVT